jgi:hypothetical protein
MEPHMKPLDRGLFYKYLDTATAYLEFGSGGSTYQASLRPGISHIISIESDYEWHSKLKGLIPRKEGVDLRFCDMKTLPHTWGYPGKDSTAEDWKKYSDVPLDPSVRINFVLIDGRFRVACCLKCFGIEDCRIAFDDFLDRPQYHAVLEFFEIVEQTADRTMVILKKKRDCTPPSLELIERYERIPN